MKEPHSESLANYADLESCAGGGHIAGEALTEALAGRLARISHQLTVEARDRPAITSLRLLTVLNVLFKYARIIQETGRRAARALY